jgi:putative addiction module component (TIGR02574 family)
MSAVLEKLKAQALKLSPADRDELVRSLIASVDDEPEDTPEAVARAWDAEIEQRISDLETGRTKGAPAEEVLAEIRALIAGHGRR